jgi:hypothetical protein
MNSTDIAKKVILSILVAAVVFGLGYFAGSRWGIGGSSSAEVASLQAQIEKAKKFFPPSAPTSVLGGTVLEVGNGTLVINVSSTNPFGDTSSMRTVAVSSATAIEKQTPKSPAEFQKEVTALQKIPFRNTTGTPPLPPLPYSIDKLMLSDLRVGDLVTVESTGDISASANFAATRILSIVQSTSTLPGSLPPPMSAASTTPVNR